MKKLIECVPNFSEGRDMDVIKQITNEIEKIDGVKLLDIDPGAATNRTVVTFVGTPDEVIEAAFQAVKKASELINMRLHKGAHPRFGATDVLPLVPVSNITMEETVVYARKLGERIGKELGIPIYCYESAAFDPKRQNLAYCRSGEYEGLKDKITKPEWKPDFGPAIFNEQSGAIAVGARDFLVAINYNLNTTSTRRANAVAFDVREKGRPKREGNPITGKTVKDVNGEVVNIPGSLKACKAIGWFIEEYGIAQVSMNLTNISVTPIHVAFDEVCKKASERGLRVTGSEIVGLVPKRALIEAGKYFLQKQQRSVGVSEEEIIKIAVKSMGLDDLKPFIPSEKIIEYVLAGKEEKKLIHLTCKDFASETASESPAPGGGSISAYMGALAASLGSMVANLSAHKPGWDDRWEEFSAWAEKGQMLKDELLFLVDEDTAAFNKIMAAFELPKSNDAEKLLRKTAIQDATRYATEIPLRTMQKTMDCFDLLYNMVLNGNPNSVTDAGVGVLAARAAVFGAGLNVKINASGLDDKIFANDIIEQSRLLEKAAMEKEIQILELVNGKILS